MLLTKMDFPICGLGALFYYGHSSVANDFEFPIQFVKFLTVFMPFMIFSSIINHFSRALIESNKIGAKFKFFIFPKFSSIRKFNLRALKAESLESIFQFLVLLELIFNPHTHAILVL